MITAQYKSHICRKFLSCVVKECAASLDSIRTGAYLLLNKVFTKVMNSRSFIRNLSFW